MIVHSGQPFPLGATLSKTGINFSLFSPFAQKVELLIFKDEHDTAPEVFTLKKPHHKTYYYWHIFIEGLGKGTLYGYRVYGENSHRNFFDPSKVLLDPYGKAIVGSYNREENKIIGKDNIAHCLKNYVLDEDHFDWEEIAAPEFSNAKNIIYELHPQGFTQHLDKPNAGTFSALKEQIPYLKNLGVNTVELMPIYFYDVQDAPKGKSNYWGYSPMSFFALHSPYCYATHPNEALNEFKDCIKEFHKNGIKVVLDVVYNHTAESNQKGPIYSFKGIASSTYYYINKEGEYLDFTGCGNTINTNHSVVRRMIIDSLQYWKKEFHIDGFRFDLAGVLTRDEKGHHQEVPPIIWDIDSDPLLAKTLMIAEPWDLKGYNAKNFPGDKWSLWQDRFRDVMRKSIRGDLGMISDFVECFTSNYVQDKNDHLHYKPQRNINFICCHDGFTLNDLVSYNHKHNEANGENNRDGSNHNLSNNYGVEGPTSDKKINQLRAQQIKNFFVSLLLSHGTPMISMGDEVRRTQFGNNNPYSLNIPQNWFNWSLVEEYEELFSFVKQLIEIRNKFEIFTYLDFFENQINSVKPYFIPHGIKLNEPDFSYHSQSIALQYEYPKHNESIYLIFNFYKEDLEFELPKGDWKIIIQAAGNQDLEKQNSIKVQAHSITILSK